MQAKWQPFFNSNDIKIIEKKTLYSGFFSVIYKKFKFKCFDGNFSLPIERCTIHRQKSVAVLLYNPEQDIIILIEQIRAGIIESDYNPWVLEPIAGMIENGDSPEETAMREAKEEANCEILDLEYICNYFVSSGVSNELCYLYCGRIADNNNIGGIYGLKEEGENIKVHAFSSKEAFNLLSNGSIVTGTTILTLQWLQLNIEKIRSKWLNR